MMSNRNRNRGKSLERWVAKDLGGRRMGILGQEDVRWRGCAIETKERQRLPVFIVKCMDQAEANADGDPAIVVLHELGKNHDLDVVMLRYKDFRNIIEKMGKEIINEK